MNEPTELLTERLGELLPDCEVALYESVTGPELDLHIKDAVQSVAMCEKLDRRLLRDFVESDGRGMDAMGIEGMSAVLMCVAMSLDPQYQGRPERIPPPRSGLRLSKAGESYCYWLAELFKRDRERLLEESA